MASNTISRLGRAAAKGNLKVIAEHVGADVDFNVREGRDALTPLMRAARAGHAKAVRMMIDYADADLRTSSRTALFFAAEAGRSECVQILLSAIEPSVYWTQAGGGGRWSALDPLEAAVAGGHWDIFRAIAERSGSASAGASGRTALMLAAAYGPAELTRDLATHSGALAKDGAGRTALMLAAMEGRLECVNALSGLGAIDDLDFNGSSALHLALLRGHPDCARALLEAGARADVRNDGDDTLLIRASALGDLEGARALLDFGADAHARGCEGQTALMEAARAGHEEIAKILLPRSDIHAWNHHYENALVLARRGMERGAWSGRGGCLGLIEQAFLIDAEKRALAMSTISEIPKARGPRL